MEPSHLLNTVTTPGGNTGLSSQHLGNSQFKELRGLQSEFPGSPSHIEKPDLKDPSTPQSSVTITQH